MTTTCAGFCGSCRSTLSFVIRCQKTTVGWRINLKVQFETLGLRTWYNPRAECGYEARYRLEYARHGRHDSHDYLSLSPPLLLLFIFIFFFCFLGLLALSLSLCLRAATGHVATWLHGRFTDAFATTLVTSPTPDPNCFKRELFCFIPGSQQLAGFTLPFNPYPQTRSPKIPPAFAHMQSCNLNRLVMACLQQKPELDRPCADQKLPKSLGR